jgi:hypothetical protein
LANGPEPFRFLSLGVGRQSITLYRLSDHGILPRLDGAIFADTQAEPGYVYETLEDLMATSSGAIPIYRVSAGDLGQDILRVAHCHSNGEHIKAGCIGQPPFYVKNAPNLDYATADRGSVLWRNCTKDYKILPIRRKIRQLLGLKSTGTPRNLKVEQWIGISVDEIGRTFCSDVQWIVNTFPLVLPMRFRVQDCIAWLQEHGYQVPRKSSCIFCPYHDNRYWRNMRDHRPDEWRQVLRFEEHLQQGKLPGVRGIPYLHRSMVPLSLAPIDEPDTGQGEMFCIQCST